MGRSVFESAERRRARRLGKPDISVAVQVEIRARRRENQDVTPATSAELIGRERELATLARFVEGLERGPGALLLRGEPGIGKTVLWRAGIRAAEESEASVLVARCAQTELPLAFGGLCDLLDGAPSEVVESLPEPQRHALAVVDGREAAAENASQHLVLPRAFLGLLRGLAARGPIVLAIDDVQWLDPASRRLIAYACARFGDAPIGVLATHRGAGDPLELRRALDDAAVDVVVASLTARQIHSLVRTRLDVRLPRAWIERVHAASGGNPMFALEFAQVASAPCGPLSLPQSLAALVSYRLEALSADVLALLAATAAAERPTVAVLQAVSGKAAALLDEAAAADALTVRADGVVEFTHPLLGEAAYAAVSPATRQDLHRRLARSSTDPEERARHVALSTFEPDDDAAHLLDDAAARAILRGAPEAAAMLERHALRLTPPSDAVGRDERAIAMCTYLVASGQMEAARTTIDELLSGGLTGAPRARTLLLAGHVGTSLPEAHRLAEEALEHVGDDAALRARVLMALGENPAFLRDPAAAQELIQTALELAEGVGDPGLIAAALTGKAFWAEVSGRPERPLLERAIDVLGDGLPLEGFVSPTNFLGQCKLEDGDLAAARELLEADLAATRRRGEDMPTQRTLGSLFDLEYAAGNWDVAEDYLAEHADIAFDDDDRFAIGIVFCRQAMLAAGRGQTEAARRHAADAIAAADAVGLPSFAALSRGALGFLALSLDEPAEAWEALRFLDTPGIADGTELIQGGIPMMPDAVEAAVALGRLEEAARLLARLEDGSRGRPHRWAPAAIARSRALLLNATGDPSGALAEADDASTAFAIAGFPLDRGRALLVAGDALRRLGERRRAAERLEAAKEIFSELDAVHWVARAEKELRRARPRPRRDDDLTAAESRVAALVAAGHTNREAAAQLFTTVKTVEIHLTRIYRKLGLRSRTELARLVADGTLRLPDAKPVVDDAVSRRGT
jgi:DNA-binding CsgD family transcriptional regulator